jgi:hypothetical protein
VRKPDPPSGNGGPDVGVGVNSPDDRSVPTVRGKGDSSTQESENCKTKPIFRSVRGFG